MIEVFTDGSFSSSTPNVGGIGIHFPNKEFKDISQAFFEKPTSQRAELLAVLTAIQTIRQSLSQSILIYSDSRYTIMACTEWVTKWKKNGWKTAKNEPVLNQDLLKPLSEILKDVSFQHVAAHTNNKDWVSCGNDQADRLAKLGVKNAIHETNLHSTAK